LRVTAAREWVDREWVARLATNYSIEMASNAFCRILGVTQAQRKANAQIVVERIHPEDRADFIACNVVALNTMKTFRWEGRMLKGREVRWVDFSSVPRPLENGDVLWTGILQDITERKLAEKALRESEERLKAIIDAAPYGAHQYELRDDGQLVFTGFNASAERILGVKHESFRGKTIEKAFPGLAGTPVPDAYRKVAATGIPYQTEQVEYDQHGIQGAFDVHCVNLGERRMATFFHDITERKRAEETLRQANEQLESKVRERTSKLRSLAAELTRAEHTERRRIAYLLHEDLQQRLAAILYKVNDLKDAIQDAPSLRTADRALRELAEAIELTRTLTTRLVPPSLHHLGLRPALETLAKEMKAQFALSVRITGLQTFRLPSDDMRDFAFDSVRELLLNVTKHAGVKTAEIRIRPVEKNRIAVEVRDKGRGVAKKGEPRDRFGLFSIRERAEAMGIGFDISSRPGKGTCVALSMPIL
jgi:PAS domain S-box-containing protein